VTPWIWGIVNFRSIKVVAKTMSVEAAFIEVAVSLPVFNTFTYEVPELLRPSVAVGKRVLAPFKSIQVTGYILEVLQTTDQAGTKKILDILDDIPMFPPSMVPFFSWISEYYRCPIGEVIKGALPGGLNITHVETVSMTDKGRFPCDCAHFTNNAKRNSPQGGWPLWSGPAGLQGSENSSLAESGQRWKDT
jgi:primosomal protein N'